MNIATNLLGLSVIDLETTDGSGKPDGRTYEIVGLFIEEGTPHLIVLGSDGVFWWGPITRFQLTRR